MNIINHNNHVLKLEITDYMVQNSQGEMFDSDWLKGVFSIIKEDVKISVKLELLIIEELERLMLWLKKIKANQDVSKKLEFIDPSIAFILINKGGKKVLKVLLFKNERTKDSFDIIVSEGILKNLIKQLQTILNKFPCRCKHIHDSKDGVMPKKNAEIVYSEMPDLKKLKISSRDYGHPYKNIEEEVAGNIYYWIRQSFDVLWYTNHATNQVTIYINPLNKLSERFATLEKISRSLCKQELIYLIKQIASLELSENKRLKLIDKKELELFRQKTETVTQAKLFERFVTMFIFKNVKNHKL